MRFHACDAAADARATVKHIHVYTEKNNGKAAQVNKKTCNYCMSDISCLHHGDRLKAAFIDNNNLLGFYLQSF